MSTVNPPTGTASGTARAEILARIRIANEAAGVAVPAGPQPPTSAPTLAAAAVAVVGADRVEKFVDRLVDYKATVHEVTPDAVARVVGEVLAAAGARSVIAPDGLPEGVLAGFDGQVSDGDGLSAHDLDSIAATVTTSALGIAETGTIVLDHGPGQGRRALTLVPDLHVCLVDRRDLVADVPEAVALLRSRVDAPARPLTWISGPSATSDIELERVEGVHGPRRLVVLVVGEAEPGPA